MTELQDKLHDENAEIALQEFNQVLKKEIDVGPERMKVLWFAIKERQKHRATENEGKGVNFAIARSVAQDREELLSLLKEQKLLADE
jgi:hypothetical protein